jgi:hypothetical protein
VTIGFSRRTLHHRVSEDLWQFRGYVSTLFLKLIFCSSPVIAFRCHPSDNKIFEAGLIIDSTSFLITALETSNQSLV